ncbi:MULTISPECIES: beta-N-acetylhexosaminidase [Burkholderia]|uniref:beta-N-acetylhexosaminidase n=1 Tax=Burkholderia TaxID=32008 RepID=UPI0003FBCD4D|nr:MULTISPECIES: family 20 glycosylhydrolase [Burkholderia]
MVLLLAGNTGAMADTVSPGMPTQVTAKTSMLPQPAHIAVNEGTLPIAGAFRVTTNGCGEGFADHAVARFQHDVERLTGLEFHKPDGPALTISCKSSAMPDALTAKESYHLAVTAQGIMLSAEEPIGVSRGLATLRQLVDLGEGATLHFATVDDKPRLAWRGLMLDAVTNFISVSTIKRQIDAMERVKLNVLHLELAGDNAFRVESLRYPRLTSMTSGYYTQQQIRELVAYASDRGITIVPTFNMPGHSFALLKAYPELSATPIDPDKPALRAVAAINPVNEATYQFLDNLFGEMAQLFPGPWIHTGGDEVAGAAWAGNADIQAFMKAHGITAKEDLQALFVRRMDAMLARHGKTMIGWDEIADRPLPKDVIVQAWRSSNSTALATADGNRVIVSAGYYLDYLWPSAKFYALDPFDSSAASTVTPGVLAELRGNPALSWLVNEHHVAKPLPPLSAGQKKRVIGAEAALWGGEFSPDEIEGRLWPRTAALAERFWSPASVRDSADLYRRLIVTQERLRILGLQDDVNRRRIAARLAPDDVAPILTLLDVVEPVRGRAHAKVLAALILGKKPRPQHFNELADGASADSLTARAFELDVDAYLSGDKSRVASLVRHLTLWRDNAPAFAQAAKGRPLLEAALPISDDLARLANAGLAALDLKEHGNAMPEDLLENARAIIQRQAETEQRFAKMTSAIDIARHPQPADLMLAVTPAIGRLLEGTTIAR